MAKIFKRGTTCKIDITVKDFDGNIVDPDLDGQYKITLKIKNVGSGTVMIENVIPTRSETGKFYYNWQTLYTYTIGQYLVDVEATLNSYFVRQREYIELVDV